jgi:uncharacterized membrane protein
MPASLPPRYKYEALPLYEAEPSPISRSKVTRSKTIVTMPPITRSSGIILAFIYAAPVIVILTIYVFNKDSLRTPLLFATLTSGLVCTAFEPILDWLYKFVSGLEYGTEEHTAFEKWKTAILYLCSFLLAIGLSAWLEPKCPV